MNQAGLEPVNSFDGLILRLDRRLRQTGPVFWVSFCGIVLMLAMALATSLMINNTNVRELERSQKELESTARLLAQHFDSKLEAFEAVPRSVADQIASKARTPAEFDFLVSSEGFHELLKEKLSATADFAGVNVFDSEGDLRGSSESWPTPNVNLSDRAFFRSFKLNQASSPVLLQLVESRISRGITIVIARQVRAPDGSFLGMVTRSIPPESFQSFFSTLQPEGSLALVHRDGTLLARYPAAPEALGTRLENPLLDIVSNDGHASLQIESPF